MERNGKLIQEKYREYFLSTLAMSGSASIASIVDRIMVGNFLGATDLAATNLTSPIICVINLLYVLFINGGNTLAVTYKGSRDQKNADKCFTISVVLGTVSMALMGVLGIAFRVPIARLLAVGDSQLYQPVIDYLFPQFFLGVLVLMSNGVSAYIRVDGMKTLAIAVPIVSNVVNLLMDYVFMGLCGFGIGSAGWATNIGYIAGLFCSVIYFRSKKRSVFLTRLDSQDVGLLLEAVKTGMSSALMYGCLFLRTIIMNSIIVSATGLIGSQVAAVCMSANSIANIFYGGTTQTMLPIGGALYGEKDYKGLREMLKTSSIVTGGICFAIMILFEVFPRPFGAIFGVTSPETMVLLDTAFRMFAISIPLTGARDIFRSCLQSTDGKNVASVLSVLEGLICFIPVLWLLGKFAPDMIWLSFAISPLLAMVIIWVFLFFRTKDDEKRGILFPKEEEGVILYDFSIENSIESAEEASVKVMEFCTQNNVPKGLGNKLAIATEELCVNIAGYAYGNRNGSIDLFIRISSEDIVLRVRDNGVIFNPVEFIDDSGKEITGLKMLRALPLTLDYNRVLGFNNTIVVTKLEKTVMG